MEKEIDVTFFKNKKTKQVYITLPKKKIEFLRQKKIPKKGKINFKDLVYD